jgi:hypothetical protein
MSGSRSSCWLATFPVLLALGVGCGESAPGPSPLKGAVSGADFTVDAGERSGSSAASDERYFTLGPRAQGDGAAALRWVAGTGESVTLEATVPGVEVGQAEVRDRPFTTLSFDGAGTTGEVGRPRLPVLRRLVELPRGAQVEVEVEALEVQRVRLASLGVAAPVLPVQAPIEKLPGAALAAPFAQDSSTYGSDEPYPVGSAALEGPFILRGRALWLLTLRPVRYRPASGDVEVLSRARVHLKVAHGADAHSSSSGGWDDSPSFKGWLRANVVNPSPSPSLALQLDRHFAEGMLFIVGQAYASNPLLARYLELRRSEGHRVEVAVSSEVGATAADVRRFVQRQYREWRAPALRYVTIVGDVDDVPTYQGRGGGKAQATDLYYASIDPDDYAADLLAPDLVVSRISVNDPAELETYLARAQRYVAADFEGASKAWMKKVSFLASCDQSSVTEGTHNAIVEAYTAKALFTGTYPASPQAGGDQLYCRPGLTKAAISSALGDGRSIINFSGHGSPEAWADPAYGPTDLAGVLQPGAIPFVVSNACVTGSFAGPSDCWGETWLADRHGAILYWGASNNSYWDEDDVLERRLWEGVFVDRLTRLGDAIANAKSKTLLHYGANESMAYYFEMYNLLGDATIDLYTDVDFEIRAGYPATLPLGVDTFDVVATSATGPVAGALVSVRGDGVQQVGYTDEHGQLGLQLTPAPARPQKLQVVITAHNGKRHQGELEVIPAAGPYLSHQSHRLTSDGTTEVAASPGRRLVVPVELKNNGLAVARAIAASLTANGPDVTVVQPQATFQPIAAGATGSSVQHFVVEISPSAADGATVPLRIDWSAEGGASGTASFVIVVARPRVVYVTHRVDDAAAGCDRDGIPDVGERVQFAVTVKNADSGRASHVQLALGCAGCQVGSAAELPTLASGAEWTQTFEVIVPEGLACPTPDLAFELVAQAEELPAPERAQFSQRANADRRTFDFTDDTEVPSQQAGWTHGATLGADDWGVVTTDAHSPQHSWFASAPGRVKDAALVMPAFSLGARASLRFFHRFDLEQSFDGAVLEYSLDGGKTFRDLGPFMTRNGYNRALEAATANPLSGRRAWSGTSSGWTEVEVDLSSVGPGDALVRFRVATDASASGKGWWIDDVKVEAETLECQRQRCVEDPLGH